MMNFVLQIRDIQRNLSERYPSVIAEPNSYSVRKRYKRKKTAIVKCSDVMGKDIGSGVAVFTFLPGMRRIQACSFCESAEFLPPVQGPFGPGMARDLDNH